MLLEVRSGEATTYAPQPRWVYPGSDTAPFFQLPKSPDLNTLVPDLTPEHYRWACGYVSKQGGYENADRRLKRERSILSFVLIVSIFATTVLLAILYTGLDNNSWLYLAIPVLIPNLFLLIWLIRLATIIDVGVFEGILIAFGFLCLVPLPPLVGLFFMVKLQQRIGQVAQVRGIALAPAWTNPLH